MKVGDFILMVLVTMTLIIGYDTWGIGGVLAIGLFQVGIQIALAAAAIEIEERQRVDRKPRID